MIRQLRRLLRSEDGPTSVEYAVMLALLLGVFFGAVQLIGLETKNSVENSRDSINTAFTDAGVDSL
ncbi:MAG: Flp family type IVb pilin [Planctomycetales bacterium]|nr:Flp family type IVb pilin [Planctomycetales bacterium]